jgi:DnaJ-class molecular chaperone
MDYYEALNLPKNATPEQIKKQFRKMSLECHPDRPNGNVEQFKVINEAYETLADPQKRGVYDHQAGGFEAQLFEMIFGGQHNNPAFHASDPRVAFCYTGVNTPAPLSVVLEISLDQAYTGCLMPVSVTRAVQRKQETEVIYVQVPAGADDNEVIVLKEKGDVAQHCAGDVRVVLRVANKSPKMTRKGLDLHYAQTITLKEALCGFSFDLEYLQNKKIKVNSSSVVTPSNSSKIVQKMGMRRGGDVGNLIVNFNIHFPETLTEAQLKWVADNF